MGVIRFEQFVEFIGFIKIGYGFLEGGMR